MIPVIHELGYLWWTWGGQKAPLLLQGLILAVATFVALNVTAATFLLFTAISTIYYVVTSFPENPNHITLLVFCNIAILISLPLSVLRTRPICDNDMIFAQLKPLLRLLVMTLLFVAGFHKFNADFLNPEISCVNLVLWLLEKKVFVHIFGIPALILLSPIMIWAGYWVVRKFLSLKPKIPATGWASLVMLAFVFFAGLVLSSGDLRSTIVGTGAIVVVLWQLVEGPLLFLRRLQAPILLISLVLLGTIIVSGIPMFPAMLFPLLFAFIPDHIYVRWRNRSILRVGGWEVHSIYLCLFLNLVGASLMYINESVKSAYDFTTFALYVRQIFFLGSMVLLLIPLLREALCPRRERKWEGVEVWARGTPRLFMLFPIILFLWGMTPYLGLRTTGNFSMFSNIRTEGLASNHLLLWSNPFKLWGYQEDRVKIIAIDDEAAKIGHHYDPLEGNSLPVVEFRKLVTMWKESGRKVALTYQYQSDPVSTQDIVNDQNWSTVERSWQTFWLDFRPVQESGSNQCRW